MIKECLLEGWQNGNAIASKAIGCETLRGSNPLPSAMKKDDLREMKKAVLKVTEERGWGKFHTPKNMAIDIATEMGEMLEHFTWATDEEIKKDKKRLNEIKDEMADVLHSLILLADCLKIDLGESFWKKLEKVKKKYPVK